MKIIKNTYLTKQGEKAELKIRTYNSLVFILAISLSIAGLLLIGSKSEDCKNLGIGIISSSVVTISFLLFDFLKQKALAKRIRASFVEKLELFLFDIINASPRLAPYTEDENSSEACSIINYITSQHRKFHNYYKSVLANNCQEEKQKILINEAYNIFNSVYSETMNLFRIYQYQDIDIAFYDNEKTWIWSFYNDVCSFKELEKNDVDLIMLAAEWFTDINRILNSIKELEILKSIKVTREKGNGVLFDYKKIFEDEPFLKNRMEFNKIRMDNYKKYFGARNSDIRK